MKIKPRILIIEDETSIRKVLLTGLSDQYSVVEARDGREGLLAVATHSPDAIVLDIGLPDLSGQEVVARIREAHPSLPIIILSAMGQETVKVELLDAGADDYLTKPFSLNELAARIRVAIRRSEREKRGDLPTIFEVENLKINFDARIVTVDGKEVALTPIEFRLLVYLAGSAGRVVTHQQLLTAVWGEAFKRELQYLRVYMGRLRSKLGEGSAEPHFISTEPGVGYRFSLGSG